MKWWMALEIGVPRGGEAIDSAHIPILGPDHLQQSISTGRGTAPWCFGYLYGRFTDINEGWSGKVHDAHSFRNNGLYGKLGAETFSRVQDYSGGI